MPDLNDVYRYHLHTKSPTYTDQMLNWIGHLIQPFRLTEITIYLQPDFASYGTCIIIEARNLPGHVFKHTFGSSDFLEDRDNIARTVAERYAKWLQTLTVAPEDHIELGEN